MSTAAAPRPAAAPRIPPRIPVRAPAPRRALVAVVRRGLADGARPVLAWGGGLGAFGAFVAAIHPAVRGALADVSRSYPSGLKEAFGATDLSSAAGYVHAELFSMIVPLAVAAFAIRSVTRMLGGAEERHELDTLLALPLPRPVLAAAALLVSAAGAAAVLLLTVAATLVAGLIAGTGLDAGDLALAALAAWPPAVVLAAVAVLTSGALRHAGSAGAAAFGVLLAMYALDLAARLADGLRPLGHLTVYGHTGAPLIGDLRPGGVLAVLAVAAVPALVGAVLFDRRDLG